MKIFKKKFFFLLIVGLALFGFQLASLDSARALVMDYGTPIIAIDGNADLNVTVDIFSVGGSATYQYGYFINGGSIFNNITGLNTTTFAGGDIIDFAIYDGAKYFTLSGDLADSSYSVEITFGNPVGGIAQQPADWTAPYYYGANITWTLPATVNTNELALNFEGSNDGIAPVPEPGTLFLLGAGLVGLWGFRRKFKK